MSNGSDDIPVTAVFETSTGFVHAGATIAESNCWTMLKGGLTVNASGSAELYFEVYPYILISDCSSQNVTIKLFTYHI